MMETAPLLLPWITTCLFGVLWIKSLCRESRADGAAKESKAEVAYYRRMHLQACDQRDRALEKLRSVRIIAGGDK